MHRGAVDDSRSKLKPEIPVAGAHHAGRVPVFVPVDVDQHGWALSAASCSMASSGTTMPVLLPVTATVVSNITLFGAVCSCRN